MHPLVQRASWANELVCKIIAVAGMTGKPGHSQLCVKPGVVELCKSLLRPQRVSLHLAFTSHIPEQMCLPGRDEFIMLKRRNVQKQRARSSCFVLQYAASWGLLSQVGAPTVSQVGSGCKSRAGQGWASAGEPRAAPDISQQGSFSRLTNKPPFEGEYLQCRGTSCCVSRGDSGGC